MEISSDDDSDTRSETMSWIDDETLEDEFYGAFYNGPIDSVQVVQMLFSSDKQSCIGVSRASCQLETPGVIKPEELIPIIKCQTANGFAPFAVLRFALELDAANLNDFVMRDDTNSKLEEVTYTDDIRFPDSVKALEPTATVFILYSRKQPTCPSSRRKQTRVIRIKSTTESQQKQKSRQTTTKQNKTRRKSVSFYDT